MNSSESDSSQVLLNLLKDTLTPEFPAGYDRPCTDNDFKDFVKQSTICLRRIAKFALEDEMHHLYSNECLQLLILIIGENNQKLPWNNEEIVSICKLLKNKLEAGLQPVSILLGDGVNLQNKEIKPLFKPLLLALRPKLLRDSWKKNMAAVESFCWIISNSKVNHLCDYMPHIVPTALLLIDDFDNDNRTLGVQCLSRILEDMTLAELKYHGYGQVIYKALELLLRERDASLAKLVLGCILQLVIKLETNLEDNRDIQWSKYDDVAEIVLGNMEIEDKIDLRTVYINFLSRFIEALDVRVHRWVKRFMLIFQSYLESAERLKDIETMTAILEALLLVLKLTKDVTVWYQDSVLLILMHSFYFIAKEKPHNTNDLHSIAVKCLIELFQDISVKNRCKIFDELGQHITNDDDLSRQIFNTMITTISSR